MIQQQPGHNCLVLVTFHRPKDCLHFLLSSSPLSSSAVNRPSAPGFYFLMLPPHFWLSSLLCPFLSRCLSFWFYPFLTSPPDWPPWPDVFSSIATRAASPSAALSSFSLHTDDEASNGNILSVTGESTQEIWWHVVAWSRDILHVRIWWPLCHPLPSILWCVAIL